MVQLISDVQLCDPMDCSMPGFPIHHQSYKSSLRLMSIELMMPSYHLILCCPLPFLLPSLFPSIRVFSNESALHMRWPKYLSFSFSISLSNEYSGFIFFGTDCSDLHVYVCRDRGVCVCMCVCVCVYIYIYMTEKQSRQGQQLCSLVIHQIEKSYMGKKNYFPIFMC